MNPLRMHAPGAEGAPLLATERDAASRGVDARVDRAPLRSRATRLALAATATLLLGAGAVAVSSDTARAVAAGGIARAFALGDAAHAPDPLEADGTRPMSAYGKIAADSPLMDPSSSDDPHFDPTTVAEPDAVPGTDEGIPEVEAIDEDADGDEAAVGLAANTLLSDTTASFSLSERDARAVQDDVDGQIEREVVKLRNAATRVKDDDTAEKGKREGSKRANAKASKKASDSEPEASSAKASKKASDSEPEASSEDDAASDPRERFDSAANVKNRYAANVDAALRGSQPNAPAAATVAMSSRLSAFRAPGVVVAAAGALG